MDPLHAAYPFFGIDYGSKMAGTTVVAYVNESVQLVVLQSAKNSDADQYISEVISQLGPKQIFIDAPLSLPGSYYGKSSDFFYRASDSLLEAMSPMFLGGLTARAIKLKSQFDLEWYEVYPSALVQEWHITSHYKKKDISTLPSFLDLWQKEVPIEEELARMKALA